MRHRQSLSVVLAICCLLSACGTTAATFRGQGYTLEFVEHRSALSTTVVPVFRAAEDGRPVPVVGSPGVSITGAALGVAGAASSLGAGVITGTLIKQGLESGRFGASTFILTPVVPGP